MTYTYFVLTFTTKHPIYGYNAVMRHNEKNNTMSIMNRYGSFQRVTDIDVPFTAHIVNHFG